MKKRNVLNSPRLLELKRHRQRIIKRKILFLLLAIGIILILLSYLTRLSALNIKSITVTGNKIIDIETIKEATSGEISGNYFWVFPKTNIFYYPKNKIISSLENKFKRLKDVTLSITDGQILEIALSERTAFYTWCGDLLPEISELEQKCYFLDQDGYIFDEAPYFSGEVYFKFYGLASNEIYFQPENFQKLVSFKKTLESFKLKPVRLYIVGNGDVKIFLTGKNMPEILFKIDADFQKVAENLEAALTTEPLQSKLKNKYSDLLYIDLRFGNKVYFKFK